MEEWADNVFTHDDLLSQMKEMPFGRTPFTVYNFAEDDGWVAELSALNKVGIYDFDDLETLRFVIPSEDAENLKSNRRSTVDFYSTFKKHVENEMQSVPNVAIFIIKDIGGVFAVKPKGYDVKKIFT